MVLVLVRGGRAGAGRLADAGLRGAWWSCVGQDTEEGGGADVMSRRARALWLVQCSFSLTRLDSTSVVRVCGGCVLCGAGGGVWC